MTTFLDAKSVRRFSDRRARSNRHGTVGFGPQRARIRSSPGQKRRPEGSNSFDRGGQASVTRHVSVCRGASETQPPRAVRSLQARMLGAGSFSRCRRISPKRCGSEKPRKHQRRAALFFAMSGHTFLSSGLTSPLDDLIRKGLCCVASGAPS